MVDRAGDVEKRAVEGEAAGAMLALPVLLLEGRGIEWWAARLAWREERDGEGGDEEMTELLETGDSTPGEEDTEREYCRTLA